MAAESDAPALPADLPTLAAAWVQRCHAGLSAMEKAEFQAWLVADSRNRRAFAKANTSAGDCDWAWAAGATDEILGKLETRARRRRRRRVAVGTVASVALLVFALVWQSHRTLEPGGGPTTGSKLVIVTPEKMTLPDGSTVELKDGAVLATEFTDEIRGVTLFRGTAFFQVAKNPHRPFIVRSGGLAVQAVGTAFTVDLSERKMTVTVTEGLVRVDPSGAGNVAAQATERPLASVSAGNSVELSVMSPLAQTPALRPLNTDELKEEAGWRISKLEFTRTPLREIVAQMNAQNAQQLVLEDAAIGDLRVSGILRADKIDALVEMLANDFGVHAEHREGSILLSRAGEKR